MFAHSEHAQTYVTTFVIDHGDRLWDETELHGCPHLVASYCGLTLRCVTNVAKKVFITG
jgi:hypothetical protein